MKRLPIAALALALATSNASAILSTPEQAYIAISVSTFFTSMLCDAKVVKNGLGIIADRNGIETETLNKAIVAAINAQINDPYERDDLVPEVTRFVVEVAHSLDAEMTKSKKKACTKWIGTLRDAKTIE
jgi:hypothetical protein